MRIVLIGVVTAPRIASVLYEVTCTKHFLRSIQSAKRPRRVESRCIAPEGLEPGGRAYQHLADGLDILTRLPVFLHRNSTEYAEDFVLRCQQDAASFTAAVAALSELVDLPKAETLAVLRKYPALIVVPPATLAERLVLLKCALPASDLRFVVQRAPWLLTEEDGAEQAELALRKLKALMPALPVEQRLLDDGLWRSFASLLRDQHAFR